MERQIALLKCGVFKVRPVLLLLNKTLLKRAVPVDVLLYTL